MPDSRYYLTKYSKYFKIDAPQSKTQAFLLLLIGALAGIAAKTIISSSRLAQLGSIVLYGISTGLLSISLPALLTVMLIKSMKRRMLLKHAFVATLLITPVYALLFVTNAAMYAIFHNVSLVYVILILSNAGIYGYWFVMGRVVIGRGRSAAFTAAIQPVLNVLLYLPIGKYLLRLGVPLKIIMLKLFVGMAVFFIAGYLILYIIDRPAKKLLDTSGIALLVSLLSQWLYNLTKDTKVIGYGVGVRRKLEMDLLVIKGRRGYKAIFVNPDIHFGPFGGVGGSIAPKVLGAMVVKKYKATPFILHAPLDLKDNPISTSQVYGVAKHIEAALAKDMRFEQARGDISLGHEKSCSALDISIGKSDLLFLTRAPNVTEDMERNVGRYLKGVAQRAANDSRDFIVIDAHNSRMESAERKELDGVGWGSSYVANYETAVKQAVRHKGRERLWFGAAYLELAKELKKSDMGEGYTSACVFKFKGRKFCLIYFDANNMLPGKREKVIEHVKEKYGMMAEVCTTDTHSINALNLNVSNSLGRYTSATELISAVDRLVSKALQDIEPVSYCHKKASIENFAVWGENANARIQQASQQVKNIIKYVLPFIIASAFIAAAWLIYVV